MGLLVLVGLAAVPGCALPALPDVVVIGASLPLSGPDAEVGQRLERAYRRAVDEVNAMGGVALGAGDRRVPMRLDVVDDGGEPALAERRTDELVGAGAVAFLATSGAVHIAAQAAIAERLQRPYVLSPSDAPGLPGRYARWVVGLDVQGDEEARAYAIARRLLEAIQRAGVTDARAIRQALVP
jgi:ABC-type branched-subunit amino acid transport system substrate-binding protein